MVLFISNYFIFYSWDRNIIFFKTKDIIRELPPLILLNTGNMGLPICLFAYGSQGLGVSAAISSLIILFHFTQVFF